MRRRSGPALLSLCVVLLPAPASAATGFGPATRVGTDTFATPVDAALDATGAAAVAGVARGTTSDTARRIVVATRTAPVRVDDAPAWHLQALTGELRAALDARTAVTSSGTAVVAWTAIGPGQRWCLRVAAGPAGRDLRQIGRLPLTDPLGAHARLVTLLSGRVLLAYRDGPRLTVVPVLRTGLGARRVLATGAGSFAAAAAGERGVLVWLDPYRPGRPPGRRLWAARVRPDGSASERAYLVSRNASSAPQVGGGQDGRAIATWLRPRSTGTPAAPFTRSLWPALRPARPLAIPAAHPFSDGAPAVALAGDGSAVLAQRLYGDGPPRGEALFAANSLFGGVWARQGLTGVFGGSGIGAPHVVALGARAGAIVTTVPQPSPSALRDVVVVDRSAAGVATAGVAIPGAAGDEADIAAAGTRVLVAAAAGAGGLAVTERRGGG